MDKSFASTPEELLDRVENEVKKDKANGRSAITTVVNDHINLVLPLRDKYSIDDFNLVSANIKSIGEVDQKVQEQVASLHSRMKQLIFSVANQIEERKYQASAGAIAALPLSKSQRDEVEALVKADKRVRISCESLKTAVDMFTHINKQLVDMLNNSTSDPAKEHRLVLANALLVYELTDFAIQFFEEFQLDGRDAVKELHKNALKQIALLRKEADSLKKQANSSAIDKSLREQVEKDIASRNDALGILEREWTVYSKSIDDADGVIGSVQKKIPNLRLIRDNAKAQINVLAAVAVIQTVQRSVSALEGTAAQLEQLQLASLDADRVKRMLNLSR